MDAVSNALGTTPDPQVKVIRYVDPLILDLDGDGIEITPLSQNILFDANGDTIKTGTAWVRADDGMLVWDRNGNGLIDSGQEMFGDETLLANGQKAAHGFAALSDLDTGSVVDGVTVGAGDGVFDANDAQYANLRIWRDLNQDGVSQANELATLADTGVTSITLGSTATNTNYGDAILTQSSTFLRDDGTSGQAGSFILAQNNFLRQFMPVTVSEAAKVLPNIIGSGWVRDLQEAATLNPELIDLFNQAKDATTRADYVNSISSLLREWGNDSGYDSAGKQALNAGYGLILSEPQDSQEQGWMDMAIKASEADRNAYRSTLSEADLTKFDAMRERMVGGLEKIYAYEAFTGYTFLKWTQILDDANDPTNYLTRSYGGGLHPILMSVALSDIINENRNAEMSSVEGYIRVTVPAPLVGTSHIDMLWHRIVDDVTYNLMPTLRLAPYLDMVDLKIDASGIGLDFSRLDAGIASVGTTSVHEGAALILDIYHLYGATFDSLGWNGTDQIRSLMQQAVTDTDVRSAFHVSGYNYFAADLPITYPYETGSGTAAKDVFEGNANSNSFNAGAGDDLIDGQDGDDYLRAGSGNDMIFGGAGSDHLSGEDGADTIDGDAGNDFLYGGAGNDTYQFGIGDGQDFVQYSYSTNAARLNVLQFKAGILASDVTFKQALNGIDLELSISGTTDKITIGGYTYGDTANNVVSDVQQIKFADGTVWDATYVLNKLFAGTDASDFIRGTTDNNLITGQLGNDTIDGAAGNDFIDGGAGDDALNGGAGADTLDGGADNDSLSGGAGNDVYLFGIGDGQDTIWSGSDSVATRFNTLQFKEGVLATDVTFKQAYNSDNQFVNLQFAIAGTTDRVIAAYYTYGDVTNNAFNDLQEVKFADGTTWDTTYILNTLFAGTDGNNNIRGTTDNNLITGLLGNDTIDAAAGNDTIDGGADNDNLSGSDGDDLITGGDGIDSLYGGAGADILDGGAGNDSLSGGAGNDVYLFGIGDGQDTIWSGTDSVATRFNTLQFKAGITAADVAVTQVMNSNFQFVDLKLAIAGSTDAIYVSNYFYGDTSSNPYNDLQQVQFADGTIWSATDILSKALGATDGNDNLRGNANDNSIRGQLGNDTIDGAAGNDTLQGDAGNDSLTGSDGNDLLIGGDGIDSLYGGNGTDILDGGTGNDSLSGGAGNDVYLFGIGDGQDTIWSGTDSVSTRFNTLQFKDGITAADVTVAQVMNSNFQFVDLRFAITGTTDRVVVAYFTTNDMTNNPYNDLQEVKFADGTTWDTTYILNTLFAGTDGNNNIRGTLDNNLITGLLGNDTIDGAAGNDTIDGGAGNDNLSGSDGDDLITGGDGIDSLYGGAGADILDGGTGNDSLSGGAGNDVYLFGIGDGQDTIWSGTDSVATRFNTLQFKDGITAADVTVTQVMNSNFQFVDLRFAITGTTDRVVVAYFTTNDMTNNPYNDLQEVKFADGTTWDTTYILNTLFAGTDGNNNIRGTTDNNLITGLLGNDTIDGAAGNDTLDGGAGNDVMSGGTGNDTFYVDSTLDTVAENASAGTDTVYVSIATSGSTYTLGSNLENGILINAVNFNLTGNTLNNSLTGNAFSNTLSGSSGNDTLDGGAGNDTLTGGTGQDIFQFTSASGIDSITDFVVVDDTISISRSAFSAFQSLGTVSASLFNSGAGMVSAQDADDYLIYDTTTGSLYYDADGSNQAIASVKIAQLTSGLSLTNADFLVI